MATTWSAIDNTGNVTLSNGNLTATAIDDGNTMFHAGRASAGVQSGQKKFWSLNVTGAAFANPTFPSLGIASDTGVLTTFPGTDTKVAAVYTTDTHWFYNNVNNVAVGGVWGLNSVVDFAVDQALGLAWQRVDGGAWNGNPAAGTGGLDISTFTGGQSPAVLYPYYSLRGDSGGLGRVIANFGATAFTFAAPAGFTGFDTPPATFTGTLTATEAADSLAATGTFLGSAATAAARGGPAIDSNAGPFHGRDRKIDPYFATRMAADRREREEEDDEEAAVMLLTH